jgi:UDP-glucose 4-epimerase
MAKEIAVVYGASGFLGSHVANALAREGFHVRHFDLRETQYALPDDEVITGDIMDTDAVTAAARGASVIYNFAAVADIDEAHDRPLQTAEVNILGNLHALEAAREAGARRFVFASSIYVFSTSGSFYRASKQASEDFVQTYYKRYGIEYTILRYGSLYGRRADEHNGIYRMLREALEKGSITYRGSPDAMREYIHVEDAARMSVQALAPEFANRHLVLTGHEKLRIKDVMRMINEILGGNIDLRFEEADHLSHYGMTPYTFQPILGRKVVMNEYVDLGQGLLDCLEELHHSLHGGDEAANDSGRK